MYYLGHGELYKNVICKMFSAPLTRSKARYVEDVNRPEV